MQPEDDSVLLRRFAESQSDEAFSGLVGRHVNLVYSVALRQVGDPHHAEEITQAVFIILARKAGQLRHERALSSWLFQTTRLTANNFRRSEIRRQRREQEAYMQSSLNEPAADAWPQIAPLLDGAVESLSEKDRRAIVLRFYEGRKLHEIGTALGATEAAAEKRVNRALEKLRKLFSKRGVTTSVGLIAAAVSTNSVQAAPVGLGGTVAATAATGSGISMAITTLVKETMKTMTWLRIKFAAGVAVAALLVSGAATVAVSQTGITSKQQPQIMINALFVKGSAATMAAITKDKVASPEVSLDPQSKSFRALIQKHPDAEIVSAPAIITANEREAVLLVGNEARIGGTNAHVGVTLRVTPTLQPGPVIRMKLKAESSELLKGKNELSTVSTATELSLPPNVMAFLPVGSAPAGTTSVTNQMLHLFVYATLVSADGKPLPAAASKGASQAPPNGASR